MVLNVGYLELFVVIKDINVKDKKLLKYAVLQTSKIGLKIDKIVKNSQKGGSKFKGQ